jgi:hypothetical protein
MRNDPMFINRKVPAVACMLASLLPANLRAATRGSDELFWCPTFDQALEMSAHTGKPIFLMFYTNVGEGCPTFSGKGMVL